MISREVLYSDGSARVQIHDDTMQVHIGSHLHGIVANFERQEVDALIQILNEARADLERNLVRFPDDRESL